MAVLVIADHTNAALGDGTAKTIAAAQKLSADIDVLVAGENAQGAADAAAKLAGRAQGAPGRKPGAGPSGGRSRDRRSGRLSWRL